MTEVQAVRLGMENTDIQAKWHAQLEKARGEKQRFGLWENPSVEFSQENLDLPDGDSEENTFWLRQKINIAGVKGLERQAAEKNFEAYEKQQSINIRDWQLVLREDFYRVLASQEMLAKIESAQSHLSTIHAFTQQRADRGDASRFDVLRIEKELSIIASKFANEEAVYIASRNRLFSKIDTPVTILQGQLIPDESNFRNEIDNNYWNDHPQLLAIDSQLQGAQLSAKAAGRQNWPEVTLGVGRIDLDESSFSADGNTFSLGLTLPLFDQGRGERRIAESSYQELRADRILLLRKLKADYESALQRFQTHQNVARQLEMLSSNSERSLSGLAEASYQAGELSVMELLDAYQSDLETDQQYINTALKARCAYIQLQYLRGE